LQTECDAFFDALEHVYKDPAINISDRTFMYWTRAVTRPLYIAPDDDEIDWLQEWEEEQKAVKEAKDEDKGEEQAVQKVDDEDKVDSEEVKGKDE
jgi:hypothetical protein